MSTRNDGESIDGSPSRPHMTRLLLVLRVEVGWHPDRRLVLVPFLVPFLDRGLFLFLVHVLRPRVRHLRSK